MPDKAMDLIEVLVMVRRCFGGAGAGGGGMVGEGERMEDGGVSRGIWMVIGGCRAEGEVESRDVDRLGGIGWNAEGDV